MSNSKGSTNMRNLMYCGKNALLPPRIPFPSVSPAFTDYTTPNIIGPKSVQKSRDGNPHHQRTSSESLVIEDQPSWLDDLLNEPETPVRRGGHRRSSSDSFAYVDVANASNIEYSAHDDCQYKNMTLTPWLSQDFDQQSRRDALLSSFYADANLVKQKNRTWNSSLNPSSLPNRIPSPRENTVHRGSGFSTVLQETENILSTSMEKQESGRTAPQDSKSSTDGKDTSHAKSSPSENDTKRAKQQFAQRSRVRKLQYIAELERNVQALQAEGAEVSAELEFLNQQNLILSMENKALKQRMETLGNEQLIKYLEQEVLEKERGRLRALYQQQQNQPPQQQSSSSHRRTGSREFDSQFANLSLKHKSGVPGRDNVNGPLHT